MVLWSAQLLSSEGLRESWKAFSRPRAVSKADVQGTDVIGGAERRAGTTRAARRISEARVPSWPRSDSPHPTPAPGTADALLELLPRGRRGGAGAPQVRRYACA